ncbi:MAG: isoleucine--tRNA ligase [Planctomycetota bacterium]|nr:MAG: isoleucine--tRNA ligase [Planctomycetota bacterium]REK25881.1 MAG: isoleucine--tRNA ligase [Planctomycetota bacterium]REK37160.1 MAG: isoleucine--tRNA ligase [Planctomycetota bacterium]
MFQKVDDPNFIAGEHEMLRFWREADVFRRLQRQNAGKPRWSFLDGPITANNPMGVHHAWGRTYKDAFQRYFAMTGHELRYQNGFDCQGLWVEVEVEKELNLGTKTGIADYGIDRFVHECKKRVLRFAARQTEQSVRLGYWMEWDDPEELRKLAEGIGTDERITLKTPKGEVASGTAEELTARLGCPEWGGSYFTFSTENNETIWTFLKKCHTRGKIYQGHDVMPWSGRAGSAYSQMEVADGRKLTTHRSCFVRFPVLDKGRGSRVEGAQGGREQPEADASGSPGEFLLVWTTTPWTLTSNVACAVNPELEYVRLRAKKDDAVYYFAKDNLEFKRLESEFKEGFGRPEWSWPEGVGKLKTIAQMFKEQGGYEVEGTVKGAEMVGWRYGGPFDDLEAQREAHGLQPVGFSGHVVIDGGRDSKGNALVVAGEGTGIVHIAPGCGDVDHQIGVELGLPVIAPLKEDGTFGDGFGPFSGRRASDPETAELVFEELKQKGLLVYVETYPHIYPHCWRTGDELVFRLVDEWFINMDWRDEIKAVTREIEWLPPEIDGEEREIEWLNGMRDWMISKKRFWGLALPIWVNPEDPTDFDVIGDLDELRERAVEGWDDFEGHTPHRPWIDGVKIKSEKTGAVLSRIVDVGNPWLDAGITPFSTMHYNHDREEWAKWYPADFVTECFPGQFRNWFYSLLSLSTMMRYDETDVAAEKRPFKTLLGHRLVMDEHGQPMHKSDGTAIWFEEAAEQLGVDTLRWMYLAQNPAQDLRFGTRHPDERVTLETPEGPIDHTKEGLPCARVTSKPADEVRRMVLLPLWNSYAFFVNYAHADEFDPSLPEVPVAERPNIDQWILSNLQAFLQTANESFQKYEAAEVCRAAASFIDDLSNWYIRRNRRRFWRSREEGRGASDEGPGSRAESRERSPAAAIGGSDWDPDKLAAYQTLYKVLVTLSKALAPVVPFLAERMYRNLVGIGRGSRVEGLETGGGPESVHLCEYPQADLELLKPDLNRQTEVVQRVVRLGHRLREEANQRVRQPLAELKFACADERDAEDIAGLSAVICDELNVKRLTRADDLGDLVSYSYKPNLKTLGPKYGRLLKLIREELPGLGDEVLGPLRSGEPVGVTVGGEEITLEPEDVLVSTEQASDWASGSDAGIQIALSTALTPELVREGMARDFVRHVQQARKDANLEITDRIRIEYAGGDEATAAVDEWQEYVKGETLADRLERVDSLPDEVREVSVGETSAKVRIERC